MLMLGVPAESVGAEATGASPAAALGSEADFAASTMDVGLCIRSCCSHSNLLESICWRNGAVHAVGREGW